MDSNSQTYDVTDSLSIGEHELLISTADGWYKKVLMALSEGITKNIYGDQHRTLAEYHIQYVDGSH